MSIVLHHEIKVMRVKTKGIFHVKNVAKMKEALGAMVEVDESE